MDLLSSVSTIKGVGLKTAAKLAKAGIFTIKDLLYHFPRAYTDYQRLTTISEIRPGPIIVQGQISNLHTKFAKRRRLSITKGVISDSTGSLRVVWFNQTYRARQFQPHQTYVFSGNYSLQANRYQLVSPTVLPSLPTTFSTLQPLYPATAAIKSSEWQRLITDLKPFFADIPDFLPPATTSPTTQFFSAPSRRREALFTLHFPQSTSNPPPSLTLSQAQNYFAYEELFTFILAAKCNRQAKHQLSSYPLPFSTPATRRLVTSLPFKLTTAQRQAAWQILQDLTRPTPMNRLLQGDVGAGKTVVAALAAYQAATNGYQTALLAPTAILATQHAETFHRLLSPLGIKIALLTGATKNKPLLKRQIQQGTIDIVIGTHALLTDDTYFHRLALCIIDEQHRFGVAQRQKLLTKTSKCAIIDKTGAISPVASSSDLTKDTSLPRLTSPHLLSMTATPIPRSLQLTLFGDLDISIIRQLPANRQPIQTHIIHENDFSDLLYPDLRCQLSAQHQIYWICKNIDDNPTAETVSVKKQAAKLQQVFPKARIAFLHGRLKPAEKDQIMTDFAHQKLDILVSTTVVEVGVNVPSATAIVISDAEQYGLAQLHQLRGRVGRGKYPSACYLVITGENPPSRRLKELKNSTDGFHLAEVDLQLRGAGEIYGTLQHGAPSLNFAHLSDSKLITAASQHAQAFLQSHPNLLQYKELSFTLQKYQQLTTLN